MEVDQKHFDEEYFVNYWMPLRVTIESYLRPPPKSGLSSFHEIFSLVYKCVCDGRATILYSDLLELCMQHLKTVHVELLKSLTENQSRSKEERVSALITELDKQLVTYLRATSNISSVFCYLVKFLEEKTNNRCPLENQLKKFFCQEVAEYYVYDILDYLENCPHFNSDPAILHRFLNNLQIVSQHKYATRYFKLFARFGLTSPANCYEHAISAHLSEVKQLQEKIRQDQLANKGNSDYIIGLNPAQKRRVDERD